MNVLLFIDSLTGAGAQRQLTNLAIGLKGRGHEVVIATYAPLTFFRDTVESAGVRYVCFNKSSRFDPSPVWKLYQLVHQFQPDTVISFLRTPSIYAEMVKLLRPKMKLIVSERAGVDSRGFTTQDRIAGYGHLLATRTTANSHDYRNRLIEAIPALKNQSSVIYNGINETFFALGKTRISLIDKAAQVDERTHTRFCVVANRANRQKAPETLAAAMAILADRGITNFSIDWIGSVDFQSELVKAVTATITSNQLTERWHWCGEVKTIADSYPTYDAFILPSVYEGVANTMCEAMCCALPIIATDIADNRSIIEPANAGIICQPDNPEHLADAIQTFLQLPRSVQQQLGVNAHRRACELFSMDIFVSKWDALCQSVQ